MNRIRRDVVRLADPQKLKIAYEASDLFKRGPNRELAGLAMSVLPLPAPGEKGTVVDHRPDLEAEAERKRAEKDEANRRRIAARREAEAAKRTLDEQDSKPQPEPESSDSERHIVTQKPMMAKSSAGKAYESKVAIERHWSDGSVDYKCVDCDYTTPHRLSIRGHRGKAGHTRRGGRDAGAEFPATVPLAVTYKPRQSRVEALAEELAALVSEGTVDPAEIARTALMWVHEQSRKGSPLSAEREPMTAEETLNRIRLLLDSDKQAEVDQLQARVDEQDNELQTLRDRVEELESFIELAQSLRRKVGDD
jgi:hypothetical protein